MQRETIGLTLLASAVLTVLGIGAYLWFAPAAGDAPDEGPEPVVSDNPPTNYDVPRCPISLTPPGDFERIPLDRRTPHIRLRSRDRGITIDVSCRTADKDFDRRLFLEKTLGAVREKFGDDLLGEREFDLGEASGWTLRAEKEGGLRFVNVLIHGRDIVLINLHAPIDESSRAFNSDLVESKLHWPGVN